MPEGSQQPMLQPAGQGSEASDCQTDGVRESEIDSIRGCLRQMERQLEQMRRVQELTGAAPSRIPGIRGTLKYAIKTLVYRVLGPYRRSVHQFHLAAIRTAEQQARTLHALARRIDQLGLEDRQSTGAMAPAPAEDDSQSLPFGVNVLGFVTSEKGMGEAVRSNLRICKAAAIPYVANSFIDPGSANVEQLPASFSPENPYRVNLITINPDYLSIAMENSPCYRSGRYNIGYWPWELPVFPREWYGSFGYVDEIWAPSSFTRQAIESASPVPVLCVPLSIDPDFQCSPEWTRQRLGIPEDVFLFLFFFDFHSVLERKNPGGLIRAFKQAFGGRKDVMLLIKCSHSLAHQRELHDLKKLARGSNVRIFGQVLPRAGMYSLMSFADAYVSLHRSEGFGLTLSEAMLCGKPAIATGYSGNMEFMSPSNSFLVRYRMAEIEKDLGPYKKGNVWADPDLEHASELMLRVVEDRKLAADVAGKGREDVLAQLHPATIAKRVKQRLDELAGKLPGGAGRR